MINKKHLMNLEGLVLLNAIAQYGGKRKAAIAFNTSLDTVSKYVDNLEKTVGYPSLVSDGRGSRLTLRAQELADKVKGIEGIFEDIYDTQNQSGELKGDVRISLPLSASTNIIPCNISYFFERYPEIRIISTTHMDNIPYNSTEADIGISIIPPSDNDQILIYTKKVECGFFASPAYISKFGYPRNIEDLLNNHRIVFKHSMCTTIPEIKNFLDLAKHIVFTSNSTLTLMSLIKHGLGIGLMPLRFSQEDYVHIENIICDIKIPFYLIGNTSSVKIPKVRAVIQYYMDIMSLM